MSIERDGTMTLIREAAPRDAASIARVHVESWRNSYAGIIPDKVLLRLTVAEHEARWWRHALYRSRNHFVYVVDHPDDGVVGFGSGGGIRDRGLPFKGEVYTLYLLDDYHGKGIGKRLFQALAQRLVVEFGPTLIVWGARGQSVTVLLPGARRAAIGAQADGSWRHQAGRGRLRLGRCPNRPRAWHLRRGAVSRQRRQVSAQIFSTAPSRGAVSL